MLEAEDLRALANDCQYDRPNEDVRRIGKITGGGGTVELKEISRPEVRVDGRWRRLELTDPVGHMIVKIAALVEAEEDPQMKTLNPPIGRP